MQHYVCVPWKVRLRGSCAATVPVVGVCPECSSRLEAVARLAALVGFRSVIVIDGTAAAPPAPSGQRVLDCVDEFVGRRAAILERDGLDAGQWLDDDGGRSASAVELPPPQTYP